MSDMILISPLSKADAQELIQTVRFHLFQADRHENIARQAALRFQKQEGWKSLGYPNLRDCFVQELGVSWQHGYRLIAAAEVDQDLGEFSPLGETFTIPETHARQLHKLPRDKRYVAYDRAQMMTAAEGKELAARHLEVAVEGVKAEIAVQNNPVISRAVAAREITPSIGVQIKRELESLPAPLQANVLTLMTKHGLRDPKLVVPLAEISTRPDSKILDVIQRTGHIGNVPLAEATLTDLKKEAAEAQKQRIAEALEEKHQQMVAMGVPVQEPVIITVYRGAPKRTYAALVQALGVDDLKTVAELLMEHVTDHKEKRR